MFCCNLYLQYMTHCLELEGISFALLFIELLIVVTLYVFFLFCFALKVLVNMCLTVKDDGKIGFTGNKSVPI